MRARRIRYLMLSMAIATMAPITVLNAEPADSGSAGAARQTVNGIGGLFFRADEPAVLARWYERHLGISLVPGSYEQQPWHQAAGPTVFSPIPRDATYFGSLDRPWMINFRVDDLDAFVAQLRAAGIAVEIDPEDYPNGRFARLQDPEGNPIQLWQPR